MLKHRFRGGGYRLRVNDDFVFVIYKTQQVIHAFNLYYVISGKSKLYMKLFEMYERIKVNVNISWTDTYEPLYHNCIPN